MKNYQPLQKILNKKTIAISLIIAVVIAFAFKKNLFQPFDNDSILETNNLTDLQNYITEEKSIIEIPAGAYFVKSDVTINENQTLIVRKGTIIKFFPKTRLNSYGKIYLIGDEFAPIILDALDKSKGWRGMLIKNNNNLIVDNKLITKVQFYKNSSEVFLTALAQNLKDYNSVFNNVVVSNVRAGEKEEPFINNYSAALEIANSRILVLNSIFNNIDFGGAIQLFKSSAIIYNNTITGNFVHKDIHMNQSLVFAVRNKMVHAQNSYECNDGFWILNSISYLKENVIIGKGDDAIDTKKSLVFLNNNFISNNKDEAIDLDLGSMSLTLQNTLINNSSSIQSTVSSVSSYEDINIPAFMPTYIIRQGSAVNIQNENCKAIKSCIAFKQKEISQKSLNELKNIGETKNSPFIKKLKTTKFDTVFSDTLSLENPDSFKNRKNSFDNRSLKEVLNDANKIDRQLSKTLERVDALIKKDYFKTANKNY